MVSSNIELYQREKPPLGISWEDWTIFWWRWILSIPKNENPGMTGKDSVSHQMKNNVLFLAGTFGGKAERRIEIPKGISILIPIINFTTSYAEEPFLKCERDLLSRAKKDIDDIVKKEVILDGVLLHDIERYRVTTKPFKIVLSDDNVFNAGSGQTVAVSDGYWLFLRPLHPGEHQINALGSCSSGKTSVDITYNIVINDLK